MHESIILQCGYSCLAANAKICQANNVQSMNTRDDPKLKQQTPRPGCVFNVCIVVRGNVMLSTILPIIQYR